MSQNRSRAKGDRFEREVVDSFAADGLPAQRVPLSGSAGGMFSGDIQVLMRGGQRKLECKMRADRWTAEYGWLDGNFALVVKRDRREPLVILRLKDFIKLAAEEW